MLIQTCPQFINQTRDRKTMVRGKWIEEHQNE